MRGTGDKGAKADHPDILKKKLSQDSPTRATALEPTQIGIHLLIPESQTPLLITFWKGLDKGNSREVAGSREYESYIQMRYKCWYGGGEDGGWLLERLLNQERMVMHLARPGHRTLNTHVWSNQRANSRPLTGRLQATGKDNVFWLPSLLQTLLSLSHVLPNNPENLFSPVSQRWGPLEAPIPMQAQCFCLMGFEVLKIFRRLGVEGEG